MSAFIVSTNCMDRVVETILQRHPTATSQFLGLNANEIGAKLYAMNKAAVDYRYSEDSVVPEYIYHRCLDGEIARYKAIQCYLYQCSEGRIDETLLFKEIEAIAAGLAETIIGRLPQYEAAGWD